MYKIITLGDVHLPFHDADAINLALAVIDRVQPDEVVQVGDMLDCYQLSRFDHDPALKHVTLNEEARYGRAFIRAVKARTDKTKWLGGNHEYRLHKALTRAPELYSTHPSIRELLQLTPEEYVPYEKHYVVGKMRFVHDLGPSGVNAIRQTLEAAGHNITFGHTHQLGVLYDGSCQDSRHAALNVGWLGNPEWATYAKPRARARWQHGLGYIEIDLRRDGECWVNAVPFVNGGCNIPGYGRVSL